MTFVRTLIFYAAFWRILRLKCKLLFSSVRENQLNLSFTTHRGSICYSFLQHQANDGRSDNILLRYQSGRWNDTWGRQEIYIYESSSKIDYNFNGFNGNKMTTTWTIQKMIIIIIWKHYRTAWIYLVSCVLPLRLNDVALFVKCASMLLCWVCMCWLKCQSLRYTYICCRFSIIQRMTYLVCASVNDDDWHYSTLVCRCCTHEDIFSWSKYCIVFMSFVHLSFQCTSTTSTLVSIQHTTNFKFRLNVRVVSPRVLVGLVEC